MKTENEEKTKSTTVKKVKRQMSIFTVFIWLALIVVMSVIVVQGINKTNALEGETRKITVKVDFSEFFEKEGITEENSKVNIMQNTYEVRPVKTNNITLEEDWCGAGKFITNEGDIGVYEVEVTDEVKYIQYHQTNFIDCMLYSVESETNEIEYINDYYERKYYGEKIKGEQDVYEVKLQKRTDLKKAIVKVDFSEYFANENINNKVDFMKEYFVLSSKTNNLTNIESDLAGTGKFVSNEDNIGVYEVEMLEDAKCMVYISPKYYSITSEAEMAKIDTGDIRFYLEEIIDSKEIYEIKLKKNPIITVKVDFSEYFTNEKITESNKLTKMRNYVVGAAITNNITNFNSDIIYSSFIKKDGNIGIYEIEKTEDVKYIVYTTYKDNYYVSNETGVSKIIVNDGKGSIYTENIDNSKEVYEVKLNKEKELKIRLNLDGLNADEMAQKQKEIEVIVSSYNFKFDLAYIENNTFIYEASKKALQDAMKNSGDERWNSYDIYIKNIDVNRKAIQRDDNCYFYYNDLRLYSKNKNDDLDQEVNINYKEETKINVSLEVEGLEDEEISKLMENRILETFKSYDNNCSNVNLNNYYVEDNKQKYEFDGVFPNEEFKFCFYFNVYDENVEEIKEILNRFSDFLIEYEINGEKMYVKSIDHGKTGQGFTTLSSGEILNINVKISYIQSLEDTLAKQSIKWINKEKGIASVELGYTSNTYTQIMQTNIYSIDGRIIYVNKLTDDFVLSSEYENDSKWSILESVSSEEYFGVPINVLMEFSLMPEKSVSGKKYVYIKDTNTVYWLEDDIKLKEGSTRVNVVYKNYENLTDGIEIESSKDSILKYDTGEFGPIKEDYNIASPKIKFIHKKESVIKVEKNVKEKGNNTYYVGLFSDSVSNKTDEIYKIDTVDGKGNITINTNGEKIYVYEVDKEGNKVIDEDIKYSKNELEFKNHIRDAKIESDKNIISSVMSEAIGKVGDNSDSEKWEYIYDEEMGSYRFAKTDKEKTVGTGEDTYIDNVLEVVDIYQENVVITSDKIAYKVEYVAEEGGIIDGKTSEIVNLGETPSNIPTPKAEDGYKFVRWEVEENGERIKVNPSEYVIKKDTVFYAIFEKVEEVVDTSDINVWIYVGIAVISVILIVIIFVINKKGRTKKLK